MRSLIGCTLAALLASVSSASAQHSPQAVRAWEGTLTLPTTVEGPADANAPFDLFAADRFNYPYALRTALTGATRAERYRALFLENEFLKVTVLPELGGHLYSCLDKVSGHEMFYANRTIKKALIGYRGAWAAFGIEFNFPISHNWMSISPVSSAIVSHPDGSGSLWVGNVDAVFGSQWRVELRLRPGRAVLEQHTTLVNQSDARHRYYWWTNAAVQVDDDSRLIYPTHLMATHGFTAIVPWPIDAAGRDLSVIRQQTDGPVSLFTYGTREPFIGVWHPSTRSGTVHVTAVSELPTSKVWSWGFDQPAHEWRRALSDDQSAYIELQAGLFRNQETYGFIEPQEQVRFTEYWIPARDIDGITRATADAIFHVTRRSGGLTLELNVTRLVRDAHVRLRQGDRLLYDGVATLSPRATWRHDVVARADVEDWTFELRASNGATILSHTARGYDALSPADVTPGPQSPHRYPTGTGEGDYIERGHDEELNGRRLDALATYQEGLSHFPHSAALNKAAGRLATSLNWAEQSATVSGPREAALPEQWLTSAFERDTTDMETRYYLGLADMAQGRDREALGHLEAAQRFARTRAPALLQLARLAARQGDIAGALGWLQSLVASSPDNALAGAMQVACLRRARQPERARERLAHWRAVDPTSLFLRYEADQLVGHDEALWRELGADSERVLDLVDQYLALGAYDSALTLLTHRYPIVQAPASEPGALSPPSNPLIAYYRGYVRRHEGGSGEEDFRAAGRLPLTYVFPHRRSSYAVLRAALDANPADAHATFLLGALHLADGLVDAAIEDWNKTRTLAPETPTLARNLGLTLLRLGRLDAAIDVLDEGVRNDARNVDVYSALDAALSAREAPSRDRAAALERYPEPTMMPPSLVYHLAMARAEGGDTSIDALFTGRFFPPEEGGTGPERVLVAARVVGARAAAAGGQCDRALSAIDGLTRLDRGMSLIRDATETAAADPLMQLERARVEAACGHVEAARERWQRIAQRGNDEDALQVSITYEAAAALDSAVSAEMRRRLEAALTTLGTDHDLGDARQGRMLYAQARLLAALGRVDLARDTLRRVFLLPDRGLSHALARLLQADLREPRP